jgi:hypothetical protein
MYTENIPNKETYRKLPTRLFLIRVPIIATYSDDEMMLYGLPTDTINDKPDPKCYENMTTSMMNIDRMISIYENGFRISIIKQEESAIIYKALEQFLIDWNTTIQYSPNMATNTKKDDRLESIDKFLTEMFDSNRPTILKDIAGSQMGYSMDMGLMSSYGGMANNKPNVVNQGGRNMGITAGYDQPQEQPTMGNNNNTYIQPYMPNIDVNKVVRKNIIKLGGNITAGYNDIIK